MARKSLESLGVVPLSTAGKPEPPGNLDAAARELWRVIINSFPANHFNAGDLVLLREFCFISATQIPRLDEKDPDSKNLAHRVMLIKTTAMLATKLRLCVSSRSRGDSAEFRNSTKAQTSALDWSKVK